MFFILRIRSFVFQYSIPLLLITTSESAYSEGVMRAVQPPPGASFSFRISPA